MDGFSVPSTVFVAFGVITAALLAGFFSFLNLISAKENKVSEFRLAWVDGLREEISIYTAAVQELVRVDGNGLYHYEEDEEKISSSELSREWFIETRDAYARVGESLSKIQLRLNPKHIKEYPDGHEAKLMSSILETRDLFNKGYYAEASLFCVDIRDAAAPLLKKTWDQVKKGELGFRIIRASALAIIFLGTIFVMSLGYYLVKNPINETNNPKTPTKSLQQNLESNIKAELPEKSIQYTGDSAKEASSEKSTVINIAIGRQP